MRIRVAGVQDKEIWDAYVASRPEAAPYCQFAWKEAVEEAYGYEACYLLAEEGGGLQGVLPLFIFKVPFSGTTLVSLPFCDGSCVLAKSWAVREALLKESVELAKRNKAKAIHLRSLQEGLFAGSLFGWHLGVQTDKVNMLLHLPDSSEELWDGFRSKLRSQVRKAEKNGLHFRWGSPSDLPGFYDVFSRNMRDLGSPVHSEKWMERVFTHYGDNARMGLVFMKKRLVAGAIILFSKDKVSVPWASTLREFNRLSPNMMLYWNLLKFAADSEKLVFDFGRSTPHEGTYKFKSQWGAKAQQLYWYDLRSSVPSSRSVPGPGREQLKWLWQKIPLPVTKLIGPKVRKFISL